MFNNPRYTTKGVTERIPIELQIFMWSAIDTMEVKKKDYLQVFNLYVENVDGRSVINGQWFFSSFSTPSQYSALSFSPICMDKTSL